MNVELLACALGQLAMLYARRLQAYTRFLKLQIQLELQRQAMEDARDRSNAKRKRKATSALVLMPPAPDGKGERRLSTVFPTAGGRKEGVGAVFEVHPQNVANKLLAVVKFAQAFDRVVGPRHPHLLDVGKALAMTHVVAQELKQMGYLLILDEAEGLMSIRRLRGKRRNPLDEDLLE